MNQTAITRQVIALLAAGLALGGLVVACGANRAPAAQPTPTVDLVNRAAVEATLLVQHPVVREEMLAEPLARLVGHWVREHSALSPRVRRPIA